MIRGITTCADDRQRALDLWHGRVAQVDGTAIREPSVVELKNVVLIAGPEGKRFVPADSLPAGGPTGRDYWEVRGLVEVADGQMPDPDWSAGG